MICRQSVTGRFGRAVKTVKRSATPLETKGVEFGFISAESDGSVGWTNLMASTPTW
jgi:hypothetical protein